MALFRVTLEALSPLSIGGEDALSYFDMNIARDANGLPTIPGSSIAGVLRHMTEDRLGSEKANKWFGFNNQTGKVKRRDARLKFTFGYVHNSKNEAVRGMIAQEHLQEDEILNHLVLDHPMKREHVAINARGVTDGRGKFERIAAPKGTRFSFEVSAWLEQEASDVEIEEICNILTFLKMQEFRLGGSTRRGYGQVKVDRFTLKNFNVNNVQEIRNARNQVPSDAFAVQNNSNTQNTSAFILDLKLTPLQFWRIGSGDISFTASNDGKEADLLPLIETQIQWPDDKASDENKGELYKFNNGKIKLAIPASSIKGALRHRTLFHYNRLSGRMIDVGTLSGNFKNEYLENPDGKAKPKDIDSKFHDEFGPNALDALFGSAKERKDGYGITLGQIGLVILDDAEMEVKQSDIIRIEHNSIDRFTGGVLTGYLYSEEVVTGGTFNLKISLLPFKTNNKENKIIIQSFCLAIEDLVGGRLAIGAKSYGFCKGEISVIGANSSGEEMQPWQEQLIGMAKFENDQNDKEIENA